MFVWLAFSWLLFVVRLWWPESAKLKQDLMKIVQLDAKVTQELQMLREKIDKMTTELETYSDVDKLKRDADAKKKVTKPVITYWVMQR